MNFYQWLALAVLAGIATPIVIPSWNKCVIIGMGVVIIGGFISIAIPDKTIGVSVLVYACGINAGMRIRNQSAVKKLKDAVKVFEQKLLSFKK